MSGDAYYKDCSLEQQWQRERKAVQLCRTCSYVVCTPCTTSMARVLRDSCVHVGEQQTNRQILEVGAEQGRTLAQRAPNVCSKRTKTARAQFTIHAHIAQCSRAVHNTSAYRPVLARSSQYKRISPSARAQFTIHTHIAQCSRAVHNTSAYRPVLARSSQYKRISPNARAQFTIHAHIAQCSRAVHNTRAYRPMHACTPTDLHRGAAWLHFELRQNPDVVGELERLVQHILPRNEQSIAGKSHESIPSRAPVMSKVSLVSPTNRYPAAPR